MIARKDFYNVSNAIRFLTKLIVVILFDFIVSMFFSFADTGLRSRYEAPLSAQQTGSMAMQQRAVSNCPMHSCSLFKNCYPLQNYVQLLSNAAEAYRKNFQRPVRQQMMEVISGGVRRRLGASLVGEDARWAAQTEEMGRNVPAEPETVPRQRSRSTPESQASAPAQHQKTTPLHRFAKQPIDIDRGHNNYSNITEIHQPLTKLVHTAHTPLAEADQGGKVLAGKDPTAKNHNNSKTKDIDANHQRRHKLHDYPLSSHKESEEGLGKAARRRFVIKKAVHRFSPEEDEKLKLLVKRLGESSWSSIAKEMPGLNRKQIRDRYVNYLKKERIVTEFTPEEDATVLRLVRERGKRWSWIADELVGRTPIMVKNRFYSTLVSAPNSSPDGLSLANTHNEPAAKNLYKGRKQVGKKGKRKRIL